MMSLVSITRSIPTSFGEISGTLHSQRTEAELPAVVIWPSIFSTAAVQSDLIALLSQTQQVLAIDPPGHGASRIDVPTSLTMAACAEATFALIDRFGLKTVSWVGTSWGGLVGLEAALSVPRRVVHLTCLNTPFAWEGPGWGKPRWLPLMARTIGRTRMFADGVASDFFLPETRADPKNAHAMFAHRNTFMAGDSRQLSLAADLIFRTRNDARPLLPRIEVPTLVIAGTKDGLYPEATQRQAAAMFPAARFKSVESAHIAAVDCPKIVAAELDDAWAEANAR